MKNEIEKTARNIFFLYENPKCHSFILFSIKNKGEFVMAFVFCGY